MKNLQKTSENYFEKYLKESKYHKISCIKHTKLYISYFHHHLLLTQAHFHGDALSYDSPNLPTIQSLFLLKSKQPYYEHTFGSIKICSSCRKTHFRNIHQSHNIPQS